LGYDLRWKYTVKVSVKFGFRFVLGLVKEVRDRRMRAKETRLQDGPSEITALTYSI
jgi:hypothetical protein